MQKRAPIEKRKIYTKRWRNKNKDKIRGYNQKYKEKYPDRRKESALRWNRNNPEKVLDTYYKRVYGIDLATYQKLFNIQGGNCAICLKPEKRKRNLCVDHDHKTGQIRGLLCENCNIGIGYFADDFVVLYMASEYLKGFLPNMLNYVKESCHFNQEINSEKEERKAVKIN